MLDGKYEITAERELGERATLFSATAPDGTALAVYWYDLETPADERAFERYRALLRRLRQGGHAAVYDLVSRPGAHYVAWRVPEGDAGNAPAADLQSLEAALGAHGRSLNGAVVRARPGTPPQLYGLVFAEAQGPPYPPGPEQAVSSTAASAKPITEAVDNLWITLWTTLWKRVRVWAPGAVLALLGVFFLLLSAGRLLPDRSVAVPDVRGAEVNAALSALYRAGFATTAVGLASPRPAGTVLETVPPPGTPLRPGRTLSVRYALPAGRTAGRAPGVTGVSLEEAETTLSRAGFRIARVAYASSPAPAGTVVAQRPAAAARTAPGGRFTLLVSRGPRGEATFLPDLTGLGLGDALTLAEAAGFARDEVRLERVRGGAPAGVVLAQNLAPFTEVPLGEARLRLTVAAGGTAVTEPGEGSLPDLTGLGLAEARRRARALGLGVTVEAEVSAPELPPGVVFQRPPPGTAFGGAELGVTLNVAARPVPLPQVTVSVRQGAPPPAPVVRRARYVWQLGADAAGRRATVTVTLAGGAAQTVVRGQVVGANERLEGTYLTTATGPLVFTLTLNGERYGVPLTVP